MGIDINPVRIGEAKENARNAAVESLVRFEENDPFAADIREAGAVKGHDRPRFRRERWSAG